MENNDEQFTQQTSDRFVVIPTKISRHAAEQLERIARKKGMSKYKLLQMVCDTLIRYCDDQYNLTEEMERAMSIFEHMVGWADAMNLADPTLNAEVAQAVYILQDADGESKGFRAKMVSKPFFGLWEETSNVMQIFERIFNVCLPELYMKLYRAKIVLECNSVSEVVNLLADAAVLERLNEENRREFEAAARTDSGKAYQYGARTKAHGHRTPDSVAMDQRIKFDDDDREAAEKEASR
jgi:hypothetical protein